MSVLLENGNLLIPFNSGADDGIDADGMLEIEPSHPDYAAYRQEAKPIDELTREQLTALHIDLSHAYTA